MESDEKRIDRTGRVVQDYSIIEEDVIKDLLLEESESVEVPSEEELIKLQERKAEPKQSEDRPVLERGNEYEEIGKTIAVAPPQNSTIQRFIADPVESDKLVSVIREEAPSSTILNAVMQEIAEEAAYIKAWRNENWNGEADLSEATSKRIKMLKDLVTTLTEREKINKDKNVGKVDFYGENFQRVMRHFMEVIMATFRKVNIPTQFEDIFITQLAKEFDGFEKQAEKIYYGKE